MPCDETLPAEPAAIRQRTRIVCTLGPASSSPEILEEMIVKGMDVARLNFSHGNHESHARVLEALRGAARRAGRHVGVLQDLAGPKIRVGNLPEEGVFLVEGKEAAFAPGNDPEDVDQGVIPVAYDGLATDVRTGDRMLFDDGNLEVRITGVAGNTVKARVVRGGRLMRRKGLNLPGVEVSAPSVTGKDLEDLEWGLAHGVDAVALSFVRRASDLAPVKRRLQDVPALERPLLFAKIETPQAVEEIAGILDAVDGIMVARGDLAVEMDFEKVPAVQKRLIHLAACRDIPAITATQMLDSMTQSSRPTRAEASDVANAILDGSDAVMLSGETATGMYPVEAVDAMARIARQTEPYLFRDDAPANHPREAAPTSLHDALALGVERITRSLDVKVIVAATIGGNTARFLASSRTRVPVVVISPVERTLGKCCLHWGLITKSCPPFEKPGDPLHHAEETLVSSGLARQDDLFALAVGRGPSGEFAARITLRQVGASNPHHDDMPG